YRDNIRTTTAYNDRVARGSDAAHQIPIFLDLLRFLNVVWFTQKWLCGHTGSLWISMGALRQLIGTDNATPCLCSIARCVPFCHTPRVGNSVFFTPNAGADAAVMP